MRRSLLCRRSGNRSCHPHHCQWHSCGHMVENSVIGRVHPWTKSAAVLNHLLPPDTAYLIFSRNTNIISFCTDAEITLLFYIHLSPRLYLLLSKAWVHYTRHISFLFLPYWAWDEVIYLWLMHRTMQPTAGSPHLHCMKRVILWCLRTAQVWSSYHGLKRCSACTELW